MIIKFYVLCKNILRILAWQNLVSFNIRCLSDNRPGVEIKQKHPEIITVFNRISQTDLTFCYQQENTDNSKNDFVDLKPVNCMLFLEKRNSLILKLKRGEFLMIFKNDLCIS